MGFLCLGVLHQNLPSGVSITVVSKPPTIAAVAAAAGVSTATVSMALNGKGRVNTETRDRVRKVAEELQYRPSLRARRLRGGRSNSVALVTTVPGAVVGGESNLSFLMGLALPLSRTLLEGGYSMLLLPPLPSEDQLDNIDVDGVVLIDPRENDPLCAGLRARGIEVVSVGDVPGITASGIVDRGYSGADVSISHLVDQGARHIAVLTGTEGSSVDLNVRAFVEDSRQPKGVNLVLADTLKTRGEDGGYELGLELLTSDPGVDAIYAPTDAVAVGVLRAAREVGRSVPDDLLVSTNFNGPRATSAEPQLTALELDLPSYAATAAQLLTECLCAPSDEVRRATVSPPRLIARESTGK